MEAAKVQAEGHEAATGVNETKGPECSQPTQEDAAQGTATTANATKAAAQMVSKGVDGDALSSSDTKNTAAQDRAGRQEEAAGSSTMNAASPVVKTHEEAVTAGKVVMQASATPQRWDGWNKYKVPWPRPEPPACSGLPASKDMGPAEAADEGHDEMSDDEGVKTREVKGTFKDTLQ